MVADCQVTLRHLKRRSDSVTRPGPGALLHQLADKIRGIDIHIVGQDVSLAQDHFGSMIKINWKGRKIHGYAFEQLLRDADRPGACFGHSRNAAPGYLDTIGSQPASNY